MGQPWISDLSCKSGGHMSIKSVFSTPQIASCKWMMHFSGIIVKLWDFVPFLSCVFLDALIHRGP